MCPNLFLSYLLLSHPAVSYIPSFFLPLLLLLTLSGWYPKRVFLPSVVVAKRMRSSLVQKQRKVLFFDPRMERCELALWSTCSLHRLWAGVFHRDLVSGEGREQSSCMLDAAALLRLQIPAPGPASLHTARRCHLERRRPAQRFCAALLRTRPPSASVSTAISH